MKKFNSSKDFGHFLGLSDIDMEIIRQKKKLIQKIKTVRLSYGYSQMEVAKMVGTKQSAISRMESGQVSEVSLDFLTKVALSLGVSFMIKKAV